MTDYPNGAAASTPAPNSDPTLAANRDHVRRLANKRDLLTAALDDAVPSLCASISRAQITPREAAELYEFIRSLKVSGALRLYLASVPYTAYQIQWWIRNGHPDEGRECSGTFPLDLQYAPPKGVHCVYALADGDGVIVYVGVSSALKNRLRSHWRDGVKGNLQSWRARTYPTLDDARYVEAEAIHRYKPKYNVNGRWTEPQAPA